MDVVALNFSLRPQDQDTSECCIDSGAIASILEFKAEIFQMLPYNKAICDYAKRWYRRTSGAAVTKPSSLPTPA